MAWPFNHNLFSFTARLSIPHGFWLILSRAKKVPKEINLPIRGRKLAQDTHTIDYYGTTYCGKKKRSMVWPKYGLNFQKCNISTKIMREK